MRLYKPPFVESIQSFALIYFLQIVFTCLQNKKPLTSIFWR